MWRLTESVSGRRRSRPRPSAVRLPGPAFQSRGGPSGVQVVGKARRLPTNHALMLRPAIAEASLESASRKDKAAGTHPWDASWGPVARARRVGRKRVLRVSLSASFNWRRLLPGWRHGGGRSAIWTFGSTLEPDAFSASVDRSFG